MQDRFERDYLTAQCTQNRHVGHHRALYMQR